MLKKGPDNESRLYIQKHYDETKQRAQWRCEARTQENHRLDLDEPDTDNDCQAPTIWNRLRWESSENLRVDKPSSN